VLDPRDLSQASNILFYLCHEMDVTMLANRFNAFTDYGLVSDCEYRTTDHILSERPVVDWFEIISENYMVGGGRAHDSRPDTRPIQSRPAWRLDVLRLRASAQWGPLEAAEGTYET
jgi:hypothetical protein